MTTHCICYPPVYTVKITVAVFPGFTSSKKCATLTNDTPRQILLAVNIFQRSFSSFNSVSPILSAKCGSQQESNTGTGQVAFISRMAGLFGLTIVTLTHTY